MSYGVARIGSLVIANGAQASSIWKSREVFEDAEIVTLYAVNATDGVLTYKWQGTDNIDVAAPVWFDLEDAAAAVIAAPNLNNKARAYAKALYTAIFACDAVRLFASAVTTGIRTWNGTKQFLMHGSF